MIIIKKTQRSIKVDSDKLYKIIKIVLATLKYEDFSLCVWLTTDQTIRLYNRRYRKQDKPTDVLSFPFYPDLNAGEKINISSDEDKNLGDLIISLPYVQRAAKEMGVDFHERLYYLVIHGICHLLGYDHITESDYKKMRKKELFLLKRIGSL